MGIWRRNSSQLSEAVRIAKVDMDKAQSCLEVAPMDNDLIRDAARATKAFWEVARCEEASLQQKSRVRWLELGDRNFAFFIVMCDLGRV